MRPTNDSPRHAAITFDSSRCTPRSRPLAISASSANSARRYVDGGGAQLATNDSRVRALQNWLSYAALTTIRDLRQQLAELVAEIGFDEDDEHTVPPADEHQHAANDVHFAAELAELFRDSGTTLSPEVTSSVPNVAAVRRMKVLYAAICAGMYPNVVQVEHPERKYHQVLGSGTVPLPTDPRSLRFWDGTNFSGSFASRTSHSTRSSQATSHSLTHS